MLAYYDSHFGPVPVRVTKVSRSGNRWEIYATVTANRPLKRNRYGGKPIYRRGMKLLASEKAILPREAVIMTENGNIAATYVIDPCETWKAFIQE